MYQAFFKRFLDVVIATTAFLVLLPVTLLVTILLAAANGGQPFFRQRRPGKGGRIFTILKFRTMNDRRGTGGALLPDRERITRLGSFVRRSSLDEVPQLLNVIVGDMSLVGPRPLLPEYLPLYNATQARRHDVRPGITGWAQVNGRNAISWPEKFALDVWYVDHLSLALDMRILWQTIARVFASKGISANNEATMSKFQGN